MKKIDSLLQKAALFEKLAVYGDRGSFLRAFAQESQTLEQAQEAGGGWSNRPRPGIPAPDPAAFGPSMEGGSSPLDYGSSPGSNIKDYPKQNVPGKVYPPIPKLVQEHLSSIVTNRRWGIPLLRNDGQIGPATEIALDAFKKNMGLTPTTPNSLVFPIIEKEFAKDNATDWDDVNNRKLQNNPAAFNGLNIAPSTPFMGKK